MTTTVPDRNAGLRERKKAQTRAALQDHALRLCTRQGYYATTVEQIAEAANVSTRTAFRYFPTKEDIFLFDRLDPQLIDAFTRQPAELSPVAAIRAALNQVLDRLDPAEAELAKARGRIVAQVPELRGAFAESLLTDLSTITDAVATRIGREPADPEIRAWTGALIGALYAVLLTALDDPDADIRDHIDRCLTFVDGGLDLGRVSP